MPDSLADSDGEDDADGDPDGEAVPLWLPLEVCERVSDRVADGVWLCDAVRDVEGVVVDVGVPELLGVAVGDALCVELPVLLCDSVGA